jgi:hypothetical protein
LSIAAPVRNADGKTIAVVGARLNRRWIAPRHGSQVNSSFALTGIV